MAEGSRPSGNAGNDARYGKDIWRTVMAQIVKCPICYGKSISVEDGIIPAPVCSTCGGSGYLISRKCDTCGFENFVAQPSGAVEEERGNRTTPEGTQSREFPQ